MLGLISVYCSIINIKSKLYFNYSLPAGCGINLLYLLGGCYKKKLLSSYIIILIVKLMWEVVSIKKLFFLHINNWETLCPVTSFSSCKVPFRICTVDNISDPFDNHKPPEEIGMSKQLQGAVKDLIYPVLLWLWQITELVVVKVPFWSF